MAWLSRRQALLSQNVASANVHGYTPRDLKPMDFEQELVAVTSSRVSAGTLSVTDPHHIACTRTNGDYEERRTPDVEASPDGNSVSLEEEMMKVADTQAQFQAATNLYAKTMMMMKTALGRT